MILKESILLSICIPTYNRREKLINQIDFILKEFKEYFQYIEILVSDNESTDDTRFYLDENFGNNVMLRYWTNEKNLGLVGNLFKLSKEAKGEYIWFVGDDDIFKKGISDEVFDTFRKYPQIGLIHLNHTSIKGSMDIIVCESLCPVNDTYVNDGKRIAKEIVTKGKFGVLMFITANIIKKKYVETVIEKTENNNLAIPFLWTMVAATDENGVYIIQEIYLFDQFEGISWKNIAIKLYSYDVTNSLLELKNFGYSKESTKEMLASRVLNEPSLGIIILRFLLKKPLKGIKIVFSYNILSLTKSVISRLKEKIASEKTS